MRQLQQAWRWLSVDPRQRYGLRALQIFLGMMFLFRASTEFRFAGYLWGPNGIGTGTNVPIFGSLGKLMDLAYSTELSTQITVLLLAIAAICLIFGVYTRATTLLALLTFYLLETRLPDLADGGDNVTRLVLVYMVFAVSARAKPVPGSLRVWLHNVAIIAIALQLGILYFTSGLMKASGERWTHGTALYLISQVEWFSLPATRDLFKNALIATSASYFAMLFQIWFPMAVFTRFKLLWIAIGISFHIGIAVMMGLICFSLAMIGLELFCISDREYIAIRDGGADALRWLRRMLRFPRTDSISPQPGPALALNQATGSTFADRQLQ